MLPKLVSLIQLLHLVMAYTSSYNASTNITGVVNLTAATNITNTTGVNHTALPAHVARVKSVPTAVFHGLNDNCSLNAEMVKILAEETNAHVECIEVGSGRRSTWWRTLGSQAAEACAKI